ncbi:unnamed protein product [Brachionus calyciflorus]|uniref:Uncharacterized protein n=1 Tax=Brachionus calyciflorus TaxID=104777 RepID=A0A814C6Y6_9BILA|nr:unnamed protein product [Brachionus calyciflorus]
MSTSESLDDTIGYDIDEETYLSMSFDLMMLTPFTLTKLSIKPIEHQIHQFISKQDDLIHYPEKVYFLLTGYHLIDKFITDDNQTNDHQLLPNKLLSSLSLTRIKTYSPLQTIDDHSSSIAALRFCFNPLEKQLYLISCGNDKSIMFQTLSSEPCQFTRTSYAVEKQTFHDLNIDNTNSSINIISQDRMIRTYSIKRLRQFIGSLNEDGQLLKIDTDRNDLNTSECVGYIYGNGEVVADLKFTSDNQHLIKVSGDGCIFVWRLNNLVRNNPCRRSVQQNNAHSLVAVKNGLETIFDNDESLPTWARNKLSNLTNTSNPSQIRMTTVTTSIEQTTTTQRSRAVWGPAIDTSFAVMSDLESNSVSLT